MKRYVQLLTAEDVEDSKQKVYTVNGGEEHQPNVESLNNRIYFYDYVTDISVSRFIKKLGEITYEMQVQQIKFSMDHPPPIYLHISSLGGFLHSSIAGMDVILRNPVPVYTVIEGVVASGATLLSVVGKRRFMTKHSQVMIHQLSGGGWGTYQKIKDEKKHADKSMKTLKKIYLEHTNISEKKLDAILKRDIYFTTDEALKMGIIDKDGII